MTSDLELLARLRTYFERATGQPVRLITKRDRGDSQTVYVVLGNVAVEKRLRPPGKGAADRQPQAFGCERHVKKCSPLAREQRIGSRRPSGATTTSATARHGSR